MLGWLYQIRQINVGFIGKFRDVINAVKSCADLGNKSGCLAAIFNFSINAKARPIMTILNFLLVPDHFNFDDQPSPFAINEMLKLFASLHPGFPHQVSLLSNGFERPNTNDDACNPDSTQNQIRQVFRRNQTIEVRWRFFAIVIGFPCGFCLLWYVELVYVNRINIYRLRRRRWLLWSLRALGLSLVSGGIFAGGLPIYWDYDAIYGKHGQHGISHIDKNCSTKIIDIQ